MSAGEGGVVFVLRRCVRSAYSAAPRRQEPTDCQREHGGVRRQQSADNHLASPEPTLVFQMTDALSAAPRLIAGLNSVRYNVRANRAPLVLRLSEGLGISARSGYGSYKVIKLVLNMVLFKNTIDGLAQEYLQISLCY